MPTVEETITQEQHHIAPPQIPQERQMGTPPQQEATTPHQSTSQVPILESGDRPSYADDLVSFLTGDYYPEGMTQYDLLTEHFDDHTPPEART